MAPRSKSTRSSISVSDSRGTIPVMRSSSAISEAEGTWSVPANGEDVWGKLRGRWEKNRNKLRDIRIKIKDTKPIAISFVSDQHIGGDADYSMMEEDARTIERTDGMVAVLAGDSIDNHIKHWAAVLHSENTPDEQISAFEYYLDMFGESVMAVLSGNHDLWTFNMAGANPIRRIAARRGLIHNDHEFRLILDHQGAEYRVLVRHKARFNSSLNPTHAHKQLYRMGEWRPDIITLAHLHEPAMEPFMGHGEWRWACRPGSYLVRDPHAETCGYNRAVPTCPSFILYPGTKKIVGFPELADAVTHLKAVRK